MPRQRRHLSWACDQPGPRLALLIDHDDADREFAYASHGETVEDHELITDRAAREGWTVVSVAHDWEAIFPVQTR